MLPPRKRNTQINKHLHRKVIFCPECCHLLDLNRYCYVCKNIIPEKSIDSAKNNKIGQLKELKYFVNNNMSLSHAYQPFIIQILLINNGVSSIDKIAEEIAFSLNGDINYYKKWILSTPKDVLSYHNIVQFENDGKMKLMFELNNLNLVREIIELCDDRIEIYLKKKTLQKKKKKKIKKKKKKKKIEKKQPSNYINNEYKKLITSGENFRCYCGKTFLSAQKTRILKHIKNCQVLPKNENLSLRQTVFSLLNKNPSISLIKIFDQFKLENEGTLRTYYHEYFRNLEKKNHSIPRNIDNVTEELSVNKLFIKEKSLSNLKLLISYENGVYQCKCGKIYLQAQEKHIFKHIEKCIVLRAHLIGNETIPDERGNYHCYCRREFLKKTSLVKHFERCLELNLYDLLTHASYNHIINNNGKVGLNGITLNISFEKISQQKKKNRDHRSLEELKEFIEKKMRMSHLYQPLIIKTLLENNGTCHIKQIAKWLSKKLKKSKDYYIQRISHAPKNVLIKHGIVTFKNNNIIKLCFNLSNENLLQDIINTCNMKIQNWLFYNQNRENEKKVKKTKYLKPLKDLKEFVNHTMGLFKRVDPVYLAVVIKYLINNDGKSIIQRVSEYITRLFNTNDQQINLNYLTVLREVLIYHNIVKFEQNVISLQFELVDEIIKQEIVNLCEERIQKFLGDDNGTQSSILLNMDFSSFNKIKNHAGLTCFLVDKWYNISITRGITKYTSMDYWITFYKHFGLNYNILDSKKTHRLQLMILFSGKMVKSDSIDFNRQIRQLGCKSEDEYGIWNIECAKMGKIRLSKNYLMVIQQEILKKERIPLNPMLKIIYYKEFLEDSAELKILNKFVKEFNITEEEITSIFTFDHNLKKEIEKIYKKTRNIEITKGKEKTSVKSIEKKPSMKNLITEEFAKVIKSTEILGPSQLKKNQIEFFIAFYTHQFSKKLFTKDELNEFYLYNYFGVTQIQGNKLLSYIKDKRYGRLAFFKKDSETYKYKMSDLTTLINSMNTTPKEKTFLHFIIRIPHFLVFCILFGYSDFVISTSEEIQFFKKRTRVNTKEHFLKIYSGVYKNSKLVGKLRKYYFNMLDWLQILEFTDIIDNKITPSDKLKNFIYGDLSGDFSLPNKVGRIIEDVINDLEVI